MVVFLLYVNSVQFQYLIGKAHRLRKESDVDLLFYINSTSKKLNLRTRLLLTVIFSTRSLGSISSHDTRAQKSSLLSRFSLSVLNLSRKKLEAKKK